MAALSVQWDGSVWDGRVVPWQGWWSSKELSRRLNQCREELCFKVATSADSW